MPLDFVFGYAEILMRLEKHSKVAHHASTKLLDPAPEEMKYFCRNWLVQLGLGGPEHKDTRQILLGHLTGFAAFRSSDQMNAHKQRYAAKRREAREAAKAKAIQEQTEEGGHLLILSAAWQSLVQLVQLVQNKHRSSTSI